MSLRINHNIAAVNGHRNMVKNDMAVSKSLEKLSSGLRINRAADDAAGLIISEQMRAQIAGLEQATSNSELAISLVQTAEGALDEMSGMLKKARQLALHAANAGINGAGQLAADQSELDNITASITRIANNTQFGTKKILDGTLSSSQILNASVATQFKQTGLTVGNIDVNITTAGVKAASTATAISSNANAIALTNASTAAAVTGLSTFDNQTTLSIIGADQSTTASVTVAAGTSVTDALTALNAKGVGITTSIGASGVFGLSADDVGTYANGSRLQIQGGVTTEAIGYSLYDGTITTPTVTGVMTGGRNVEVNRSSDGTAAVATNSALSNAGATTLFHAAGVASVTSGLAIGYTFQAATTVSLVDAAGKTIASVLAPADLTTGAGTAPIDTTVDDALSALTSLTNGKFSVAIGAAGTVTITATHKDATSNGVYLKFTAGAVTSDTSAAATAGGVENTSTGFGTVALSVTGNRGSSLSGANSTGTQTVSLSLAAGINALGSYANALAVSTGAVFQIGANRDQTAAVAIGSAKAIDLGIGAKDGTGKALVNYTSLEDLSSGKFLINGRAQDAISAIDKAIDDITSQRGDLGAIQADTLETTLSSLRVTHENLTAAESTIRDVDYAHESSVFTRNNILVQASTAMLAQANQLPQSVLKLLG